jgi:hypothetical protein
VPVHARRDASCSGFLNVLAHLDAGASEIIALGQKWLPQCFRESVGKTVSEIQCRWVPALAILAPGDSRYFNLVRVDRDDIELGLMQEKIKLTASGFATPGLQDNAGFQDVCHRDEPCLGLSDPIQELFSLWLTQEDGE